MPSPILFSTKIFRRGWVIIGFTPEGGGMINGCSGGPPFFPFEGGLYTGAKWALHHLALV